MRLIEPNIFYLTHITILIVVIKYIKPLFPTMDSHSVRAITWVHRLLLAQQMMLYFI